MPIIKINTAILAGLLLFLPHAFGIVIDFDEFTNLGTSGGEIAGDEYLDLGVLFSTPDLKLNIGGSNISAPNSLGADFASPNDFNGTIVIQFTNNAVVSDLSFGLLNLPFGAEAFDLNGNLLRGITGVSDPQIFDFSGFAVNKVIVSGTFYALDDFTFTPIPEPSASALLIFPLGLVALYCRSRRIRHRKRT